MTAAFENVFCVASPPKALESATEARFSQFTCIVSGDRREWRAERDLPSARLSIASAASGFSPTRRHRESVLLNVTSMNRLGGAWRPLCKSVGMLESIVFMWKLPLNKNLKLNARSQRPQNVEPSLHIVCEWFAAISEQTPIQYPLIK